MQIKRDAAYRTSSIAGAGPIGLILALFDRLSGDLSRAAVAIRNGDIEARCREINHALIILTQLESWVDREKGGEPARQLAIFYAQIRSMALQASMSQKPELLEKKVTEILNVRSSWQLLDSAPVDDIKPAIFNARARENAFSGEQTSQRFSQSV